MGKKLLISFASAIATIRSRFFHTVLSVLGIVIGVASLVGILSLIDGMEQYANEQISKTTSLKAIVIYNKPDKVVNGIRVRKDTFPLLSYQQINQLHSSLTLPAKAYMLSRQGREVTMLGDTHRIGTILSGSLPQLAPDSKIIQGQGFAATDLDQQKLVAVVNESFVRKATNGTTAPAELLGKKVALGQQELTIVGIAEADTSRPAQLYFPISLLTENDLRSMPLDYGLEAEKVEDVPALKEQAEAWITKNTPNGMGDFAVATNEFRVQQAAQGFLVFRVIMGFIVGISVLVGGIGVMNVLLISVSERTSEIGVRKAVGAKKRDILLQFLSESVTISTFGSLLGLLTGVAGTLVIVPIVKAIAKVPFQAAYTWNTFLIISVVAIVVGIVFGTYPAMRAARLDPVEAIRRE